MSLSAVQPAENRKRRVNVIEIVYQIRSLLSQLRDDRHQSLQVRHEFPPQVWILTANASLAAAYEAGAKGRENGRTGLDLTYGKVGV